MLAIRTKMLAASAVGHVMIESQVAVSAIGGLG